MSKLGYSIWQEGGRYHWAVRVRRGPVCGHGAANDIVRARAEAIDFGLDPARAGDVAHVDHRRRETLFQSARGTWADVDQRVAIKDSELANWKDRCAMTRALVEKSNIAIGQTRQLLRAG